MTDIPTVSYDDIRSRFEEDGVRIGDVHRSHEHFVDWHARHDLPDRDADGMAIGSSRIFMSMYDAAPDGRAQRPPYVNFWHWMLDAYEDVEWDETPQGRRKTVLLSRGMHQPRAPLSDEEATAAIAAMLGSTVLPKDMRQSIDEHVRQDLSDLVVRHNESLRIVDVILDQYGDEILVLMSV